MIKTIRAIGAITFFVFPALFGRAWSERIGPQVATASWTCAAELTPPVRLVGWRELLDAIRESESQGDNAAKGDYRNGRPMALGPYQIWRSYWADGCRGAGVRWSYHEHVWDRERCEYVIYGYWRAYAPAELARLLAGRATMADCERLSRLHNGGPDWAEKSGEVLARTANYWRRVKAATEGV